MRMSPTRSSAISPGTRTRPTRCVLAEEPYWHDWKPGDLVIWNNYRALHSAAGHKNRYVRMMNRATIKGEIDGRRAA